MNKKDREFAYNFVMAYLTLFGLFLSFLGPIPSFSSGILFLCVFTWYMYDLRKLINPPKKKEKWAVF